MAAGLKPRISVIVVSDYVTGENKFCDEFRMMRALAVQDIAEPFEIILAESDKHEAAFPEKLLGMAPDTRVVFLPHTNSSALKDAALAFTKGTLVAVFEADAVPRKNWLRLTAGILDRHPGAGAVSGRTIYGENSALKRAAGLIDRGYLEERQAGPVLFVCNNGALYRRELLERFPYQAEQNPFVSGRLRNEAMRNAGVKFLFRPDAVSVHEFDGLSFLREARRNQGFSDARVAYLARGKNLMAAGRLCLHLSLSWNRLSWDFHNCRKAAPGFIYWRDWPLVLLLILIYRWVEWPAASLALRGRENLPSTPYR